jgi:hypothetical protein
MFLIAEIESAMWFAFCAVAVDDAAFRAVFTPNGEKVNVAVAGPRIDPGRDDNHIAIVTVIDSSLNRWIAARNEPNYCRNRTLTSQHHRKAYKDYPSHFSPLLNSCTEVIPKNTSCFY